MIIKKLYYYINFKIKLFILNQFFFLKKEKKNCEEKEKTCKICLLDSFDEENPFISPCECKGSMEYIHYICLKKWILNKIDLINQKGVISLFWKDLKCDLCLENLPFLYKNTKGKTLNIFESSLKSLDCGLDKISYVSKKIINYLNLIKFIYSFRIF